MKKILVAVTDELIITNGLDRLSVLTKLNDRHAQQGRVEKNYRKDNHLQITIVKAGDIIAQ